MKERALVSPHLAAYGSAVVLSFLTLAVFAYSKDQGPESAVRRYHQAVINRDLEAVRKMETGDGQYGNELPRVVGQLTSESQSVSLGKVQKDGRRAYVDVIYTLSGQRGIMALRFVVDKPEMKWRVQSDETVRLLSRMSQFE